MRHEAISLVIVFSVFGCGEKKVATSEAPPVVAAKPSEAAAPAAPAAPTAPAKAVERKPEEWVRLVIEKRRANDLEGMKALIAPGGTLTVVYTDAAHNERKASFTRDTLRATSFPHESEWVERWGDPEIAVYIEPHCATSAAGFTCRNGWQRAEITFEFTKTAEGVWLTKVDELEDGGFGGE